MPTKLLSSNEIKGARDEVKRNRSQLDDQYLKSGLKEPAKLEARTAQLEGKIDHGTADKLEGEKWMKQARRQKVLREAMVLGTRSCPSMPTRRQMEDNPMYSTNQHMTWEKYWHDHTVNHKMEVVKSQNGYGAAFEWKDNQKRLFPDELDNADISNIEQIRPDAAAGHGGPNEPLSNMKIAVSYAPYARLTDKQYDALFGTKVAEFMKNARPPCFEDFVKVE